ncbi:class I SAM-dependent methyltransferase [Palleronia sp. LCG004]|uniref:class I SAM-dependent methyltransferase n=1 Tax=Palleronia sp. LCG004 TaxID=3079304 RepID=UPI002941FD36|nr:SAM-dependent methyltransferase [Palleronia sp. LCG004]WOI55627.1 SAM-dependent methyltransferase [Palleronia sp. LCG004]
MTPLGDLLERQIRATGPITVAEYMTTCLLHPEHGYYRTRDPLGAAGDFVTAPEISQMFGELVGLALAQSWIDRGCPAPFAFVELGAGRGTLMADALRATKAVPGFHDAMDLILVETSEPLRRSQAETLAGHDPRWVAGIPDLPARPLFLIANELFDALPIRQFLRDGDLWRERLIAVRDDALAFALSDPVPLAALEGRLADTEDGDMVETSGAATSLASEIGDHITTHGGVALIVDYGDETPRGDTFQALKGHRKVAPLALPGETDLTAHVDFGALARAASCGAAPLVTQGLWLERLGVTARARALAAGLEGAALETHVAAHRRLTHPDEMGTLFKVLALHDGYGPPPGTLPEGAT